ncbi:hypothetical protein A2U01_0089668, partial [Trifolium medium]|nr:hypothetical protein [Trifolium medium]
MRNSRMSKYWPYPRFHGLVTWKTSRQVDWYRKTTIINKGRSFLQILGITFGMTPTFS